MKFFFIFALFLIVFPPLAKAQSCYVQLQDVSGINNSNTMSQLDSVAIKIRQVLPLANQSSFHVYQTGYYVQQMNYNQWRYPELFDTIVNRVSLMSGSHILIGWQNDPSGLYTNFSIDVQLPNFGGCVVDVSSLAKVFLETHLEKEYNLRKRSNQFAYKSASKALFDLAVYLQDVKDCCQIGGDISDCIVCKRPDNVKNYLYSKSFVSIPITNIGNYPPGSSLEVAEVADFSKLLFTTDNSGMGVDIPTNYKSVIDTFKSKGLTIGVFITKDEQVCLPLWDSLEIVANSSAFDVLFWHHIHQGNGIDDELHFSKTFYASVNNLKANGSNRSTTSEFLILLEKYGTKLPDLLSISLREYLENDDIEMYDFEKALTITKFALDEKRNSGLFTGMFQNKNYKNLKDIISHSYATALKKADIDYKLKVFSKDAYHEIATKFAGDILLTNELLGPLSQIGIKNLSLEGWRKFNELVYPFLTPITFGEFENIRGYNICTNQDVSESNFYSNDVAWFRKDRIEKNGHWQKCMKAITVNKWKDRWVNHTHVTHRMRAQVVINTMETDFTPFDLVNGYYIWVQHEMDKKYKKSTDDPNLPGSSKWATGASYLVQDLAEAYCSGAGWQTGTLGENFMTVKPVLVSLNLGIAGFAIDRFNEALYSPNGDGSNGPVIFYNWDRNFIRQEQVTRVAYSVYLNADTSQLNTLDQLTRKEGFFGSLSALGSAFGGYAYIPNFKLWGNPDGTHVNGVEPNVWSKNYGDATRYHVPLLMLYPFYHEAHDNIKTASLTAGEALVRADFPSSPLFSMYPTTESYDAIIKAHSAILDHYTKIMKY